jgi:3-oxoacyl-[acyl-carrier protein] reductase
MPTALVTGVSRRVGIGWTVAERLIREGWSVTATGWPPHDEAQPWGGDSSAPNLANLSWLPEDLADPEAR